MARGRWTTSFNDRARAKYGADQTAEAIVKAQRQAATTQQADIQTAQQEAFLAGQKQGWQEGYQAGFRDGTNMRQAGSQQ